MAQRSAEERNRRRAAVLFVVACVLCVGIPVGPSLWDSSAFWSWTRPVYPLAIFFTLGTIAYFLQDRDWRRLVIGLVCIALGAAWAFTPLQDVVTSYFSKPSAQLER